jgi:ornithine cyclodeaminase/alanine dehydrogenase-like protein (mu-crystallin family)
MGSTLRLSLDEVHRALDDLDPVALLTAELRGTLDGPRGGELEAGAGLTEKHVAFRDPVSAVRFLVPLKALRAVRCAGLATIAARLLVPPGAATVCVLGSGFSAELMIRMVARYVVGVSHVAVCAIGGSIDAILTHRLIDELELSGIGLAVTSRVDEATFGANLVGIAGSEPALDLRIHHLAKGAVLINCSGADLPVNLVHGVAKVCVDDLRLVDANAHRYFVRLHRSSDEGGAAGRRRDPRVRRIAADLGEIVRGERAVPDTAGVVLVEVLNTGECSASLIQQMTQVAHRLGMGNAIRENQNEGRG